MVEEEKEIKPVQSFKFEIDYSEDDFDDSRIVRKRWTPDEERIFKQGLREYGKNWNALNRLL